MLRVALTGGIATGKSYCLGRFAALSVPVIDADQLARAVVAPGSRALSDVAARFGASILLPDGSLNRGALGHLVFRDRAARADLEAIIHPEVYRRIGEWFASLTPGTRLAIADIPLLFETGHHHDFDRVIVTACDPAEQRRRLVSRDGLTDSEARARLDAQWPTEEKAARGDYVIRTDGAISDTDAQVKRVYELLIVDC